MTVKVTRPEINIRETINKLDTHTYRPGEQVQVVFGDNSQSNVNPTAQNTWNIVTTLAVEITPKFNTSLIRAEMYCNNLINNTGYAGAGIRRDMGIGNDEELIGYFWGYNAVGNWMPWSPSIVVTDQPNTTSTLFYRPVINISTTNYSNYLWNYQGPVSSLPLRATRIILTEIAQ